MNKKVLVPIALIMAVIGVSALSIFSVSSVPAGVVNEGLKYTGIACANVIRSDGNVENLGCHHNLVTNAGKEFIKQAMNGTASTNWDFLNLSIGGNGSAMAATDTILAGLVSANGVNTSTATYAYIGTGNSSLTYLWTASATSGNLNSTAITNVTNATAANGYIFAEAYFGSNTVLNSGDKLNVTYYWWVS